MISDEALSDNKLLDKLNGTWFMPRWASLGMARCKNVLYAAARANGPTCSVWQKAPGKTPVRLQSLLELGILGI